MTVNAAAVPLKLTVEDFSNLAGGRLCFHRRRLLGRGGAFLRVSHESGEARVAVERFEVGIRF
jgi:hypothetical protein